MHRSTGLRTAREGVVLGVLGAFAATGHVLYPLALHVATRRLTDEEPPAEPQRRPLTVVVPAYREANVIAAKVSDLRANGYPGIVDIVVVADDHDTAVAAAATGATVIGEDLRRGKADALNRGIAAATTEIVVITDANTRLRPGSLAALERWFVDPTVGAVAGEKRVAGGTEGAYWRFESWLKRRETRTGATFALIGELAAVRRSVFRPLPDDIVVDDLWLALDVLEQGSRIVYEPEARAEEQAQPGWAEDWERRTRNVSGVLDVLWRRRRLLSPAQGVLAAQLWGHRLVRSSLGPVAHLGLVLLAVRAVGRSSLSRVTVAVHVLGAVATVRTQRGTARWPLERLVGQALFLQAVGLGGSIRFLRGDRPALWPKPPRPAPSLTMGRSSLPYPQDE